MCGHGIKILGPSCLFHSTVSLGQPRDLPLAQRSPMGVRDHRRAVLWPAGSEKHARAGRGSSADHKSSPAKCSARRDQDHASFRRRARPRCFAAPPPGNAASGVLIPSRRRRDGRVLFSPGRRKNKDVARLVIQPWKVGGRGRPTCHVSAPWLITKVDARAGPRRDLRRTDDEIARRGGEATRRGRGRSQDKRRAGRTLSARIY